MVGRNGGGDSDHRTGHRDRIFAPPVLRYAPRLHVPIGHLRSPVRVRLWWLGSGFGVRDFSYDQDESLWLPLELSELVGG